MNPNEPLGLPRGSVRAFLAIGIIASFVAGCFSHLAEGVLTALAGLASVAIRDYFTTRSEQNRNEPQTTTTNS